MLDLGQPIFHGESGDTFEFPGITRRKHQPERAGVPYYPQIVCANPLASGFQFGAQVAVLDVDEHIQGQYRERAQQVFDLPLQLGGPLIGAPVAQFRRDDGTGEDHLWAYPLDVAGRRAVGITQQRTDCRCPADNCSQDVFRLERRVGDVWKLVFRPKRFVLSPFGQ
ncbi:hypothetical protein A9G00_18535 [Achromobacter xylosoxidans]|nr:hypothetical protein A9G00_18535 [Achromobacter xylosoxidans]